MGTKIEGAANDAVLCVSGPVKTVMLGRLAVGPRAACTPPRAPDLIARQENGKAVKIAKGGSENNRPRRDASLLREGRVNWGPRPEDFLGNNANPW